jgi:effector-binding domain-containing protein
MIQVEPALEFREEQPCVAIPVPINEWGRANALVPEVLNWMSQHGIAPAGPLFYRYRVVGGMDEPSDLEIGFPVAEEVIGDDRVRPGVIPAGIYATLVHHGHPDSLHETCAALESWAGKQGVTFAQRDHNGRAIWKGRYEFYLSSPADQPDPTSWTTEVAYLTRGA